MPALPGLSYRIAADPSVPWQVDATWDGGSANRLDELDEPAFVAFFLDLRKQAARLLSVVQRVRSDVGRVGLLYDGLSPSARLTPMAGTAGPSWQAITVPETRFDEHDPGYVDTASGPRVSRETLALWQSRLRGESPANYTFRGHDREVLFARIIRGREEHWRIFDDADSVGFLTPFANGPCAAVLVPRRNLSSDVFGLDEEAYVSFIRSLHGVLPLFAKLHDATGVGIAFEGCEVDYAHIKLYPRFAAANDEQRRVGVKEYSGMLTSIGGARLAEGDLADKQAVWDAASA